MTDTTNAVEDELEIRRLLAHYCHVLDDGHFDRLGEVFSERGAFLIDGEGPRGLGPLIAHLRVVQADGRRGVHILSAPSITIDDDGAAAETDIAFHLKKDGAWMVAVVGRYSDELVRTDDGWRIETRTFSAR